MSPQDFREENRDGSLRETEDTLRPHSVSARKPNQRIFKMGK